MTVQLLAVEGCPHVEQARRDLEGVLRESIIETPIQLVLVSSIEDAEFLDFHGSPTIRIDGEDVAPEPGMPVALACRTYRDAEGRPRGSPPLERIRSVVRERRRGRLQAFQRDEAGRVAAAAAEAPAEESSGPDGKGGEGEGEGEP